MLAVSILQHEATALLELFHLYTSDSETGTKLPARWNMQFFGGQRRTKITMFVSIMGDHCNRNFRPEKRKKNLRVIDIRIWVMVRKNLGNLGTTALDKHNCFKWSH